MSAKHSSSSAKGHPVQQGLVFLAILIIFEIVLLNLPESALKFAKDFLSLTTTDLIFIPIGSFLFFVFWKLMENAVFDPFMNLHEAREAATLGSKEVAEQKLAEATRLENVTSDQINIARRDAVQEKMEKLAEAKKEAAKLIAEAENEAMAESDKALKEAMERIAKLKSELENQANNLAGDVVEKLKVAPEVASDLRTDIK